jgi:hypothetical protein
VVCSRCGVVCCLVLPCMRGVGSRAMCGGVWASGATMGGPHVFTGQRGYVGCSVGWGGIAHSWRCCAAWQQQHIGLHTRALGGWGGRERQLLTTQQPPHSSHHTSSVLVFRRVMWQVQRACVQHSCLRKLRFCNTAKRHPHW